MTLHFIVKSNRSMDYSALGQGGEARVGWFLQGISDILLENCWSQKTRPKFQVWHLHIFSVQKLLSQGHTSQPPGQGARLEQAEPDGEISRGSCGRWELRREIPQRPSISNFPHLPGALDFWGLTRLSVKLSDTAAIGVWERCGQVKVGVMEICALLWCIPALGAQQVPQEALQILIQVQN